MHDVRNLSDLLAVSLNGAHTQRNQLAAAIKSYVTFPETCALGARLRFGIRSRERGDFFLFGWMVLSGLAGFFFAISVNFGSEIEPTFESRL